MNHFIIPYAGNKRNEYSYFKDVVNLNKVKNIIEPFCGSSAISFNLWKDHGDKFKYYLNDINPKLIEMYELMKKEEPEKIEEEINNVKNRVKCKEDYLKIVKNKEQTIYEYIFWNRYYTIRAGIYNEKSISKCDFKLNKEQLKFIEFIKSPYVFISSKDWFVVFDEYKNDKDSLFIFDPPYMSLCNTFYSSTTSNIYEYFYLNKIKSFKCKIYFILEDMWIIKLLFNGLVITDYNKTYAPGKKKKTTHIIISNQKNKK